MFSFILRLLVRDNIKPIKESYLEFKISNNSWSIIWVHTHHSTITIINGIIITLYKIELITHMYASHLKDIRNAQIAICVGHWVTDRHDLALPVTTICHCFRTSAHYSSYPPASHGPSRTVTGPGFKTLFPTRGQSSEVQGQYATSCCRVLPASRSCALNTSRSHLRISDSSGSGISDRHGDDSDNEGSVAASRTCPASDMPDTPGSKKRARPKQIQGKAWIYYIWNHHIWCGSAARRIRKQWHWPISEIKIAAPGSLDKHLSAIGAQNY